MIRAKIGIVLTLLLSYSVLTFGQDIQFAEMEPLPEARSALTSANNGESIFMVNGFGTAETFTDEIFQYDVSLNSWSTLTSSSLSKRYASAEIIGDHLYVFNGLLENGSLNSSVEKIDLTNGSIQLLSDNPQPCRAAGVTRWNDKIYSFGGTLLPNEYSNKLFEFDPENDTWTELAVIPFAGETKGEIINGKLYVIGGYNGTVSNSIDIYNLSTGLWESNFDMPMGISAHATAIVGSKIYLVGDFANLTSMACFDTADNSFEVLSNNLNQRRHCAAEGVGGSLFAIGGNTTSNIQSSIASVQKSDILTSISEIPNTELINVHPNPVSRFLDLNSKYERLVIYDIHGKEIQIFANVDRIDMADLNGGIYMLRGEKKGKIYQAKVVKI